MRMKLLRTIQGKFRLVVVAFATAFVLFVVHHPETAFQTLDACECDKYKTFEKSEGIRLLQRRDLWPETPPQNGTPHLAAATSHPAAAASNPAAAASNPAAAKASQGQSRQEILDYEVGIRYHAYEHPAKNISHMYGPDDVTKFLETSERHHFPDCLIIGSRKSGTGALLKFLSQHPRVQVCKDEPAFFSNDENYNQGLEFYDKQLPATGPNQVFIEKSAEYFHTSTVPERVKAFNSSLKLLLIVRDPFTRLLSDYLFLNRFAQRFNTIEGNFTLEELMVNQTTGEINTRWGCVRRSLYAMHFEHWLKFFPRKQILVIDGDAFTTKHPVNELQRVERFLGLKHVLTKDKFYFGKKKGFFCMKEAGCLGQEKGHTPPEVAPELEAKAREFFRKENEKFYKIINKRFEWA